MIIISLISGYIASMNMWAVTTNHTRFHINDIYMVALMTSIMVLMTVCLYYQHYNNANQLILMSAFITIILIYFIRTQTFINDYQYLNGMIPHHSMAILMSDNIIKKTNNPKIRKLAENISKTQKEEIDLMDRLLIEI